MSCTPSHFPPRQATDETHKPAAYGNATQQAVCLSSSRPEDEYPLTPAPSATNINSSRKILVVENHDSLQKMLKIRLEHESYAVRTAASSEEALRLYEECGPFFVVLINYCLPKGGIGLAQSIRQRNPLQNIVIAAFAYRSAEEVPRPQELMDVPLLIDISQLRTLFERFRYWATKDEIENAITNLTDAELLRLEQFSEYRVRGLGRQARGRTGQDLLQEVLLSTFQGAMTSKGRHWNKNVGFFAYLAGAIRSTSDNWKKQQLYGAEIFLASELMSETEDEPRGIEDVASGTPAPDQWLIARERERRILELFDDDLEARQILQQLLSGLRRNEIVQKYGVTEKQYHAALKRIRLKVFGRKRDVGDEKHGK